MLLEICSVDGCGKPKSARGYCERHYALWRRNGKPERVLPKVDRPSTCSVDGCNERHSSKGFCSKHYARWKKTGRTDLPEKKLFKCLVDSCQATKHKAHGYCGFHYERIKAQRKLDMPKVKRQFGASCIVDGCENKRRAKGYCNKHYLRAINHGDPEYETKRRRNGQGKQWHESPQGYIVRYEPENPNAGSNGQVYQHRHVMSEVLGRPLHSYENVHHINGDKSDNRPENLELWRKGQPAGQRVTDKAAWCAEFLTDEVISASFKLRPELRQDMLALVMRLQDALE